MSESSTRKISLNGTGLRERYRSYSLRERVLVSLAVLSATWMIWSITVGGFLERSKAEISASSNEVYIQLQSEVAEQTRLQQARLHDPDAALKQERQAIDRELKLLSVKLGGVLDRFVPPEQMPALLRDVIRHHDGLKLKKISKLPVEAISMNADPEAESEPPLAIYRHSMRLEFEGEYFQVLAYLTELESSEWQLGWRELDYLVEEYPRAAVAVEIETLSREKGWIGV
ncbi:MAG: hypothetical protein R3E82_18385 [Pseudomonadales bacterium]|nr:hypothetical protein [Pseudomonadales bacterium]